jgi:hypothetical protein
MYNLFFESVRFKISYRQRFHMTDGSIGHER